MGSFTPNDCLFLECSFHSSDENGLDQNLILLIFPLKSVALTRSSVIAAVLFKNWYVKAEDPASILSLPNVINDPNKNFVCS